MEIINNAIKRQQAGKNRKSELKFQLQKRKENLLITRQKDEFNFPELTSLEMKTLKEEIRKVHRKNRAKTFIFSCCILFVILIAVFVVKICKPKPQTALNDGLNAYRKIIPFLRG